MDGIAKRLDIHGIALPPPISRSDTGKVARCLGRTLHHDNSGAIHFLMVLVNDQGVGENWLGRILMELRGWSHGARVKRRHTAMLGWDRPIRLPAERL